MKLYEPGDPNISVWRFSRWLILIVAIVIGLVLIGDAVGILRINIFGVRSEDARRKAFEQTQSFNDGKRQQLLQYKLQYELEKDPQARSAIRFTILHQFAGYDESRLDPGLQNFLNQLRR